ncbi:MarR family transcriptional regulator [Leucobacter allii]|uniref:MarR family transcriptional regulator n=1 Tax=Leucobacter allii TaxID=2932247 RepID=A0ABY4FLK2_9MICO|nr:MarR family transcriptional regulator [Leucobacter allii]UOQ57148.1 MarR family transcriptional regulator [Leucobacter allii]
MGGTTRQELVEQYRRDRRAMSELFMPRLTSPFLDLELTLHQLKVVLLVASGRAASGKALAQALEITPASVSTTVERLVALDYLARADATADRRVKRLVPTPRAVRLCDRITDHQNASDDLLEALSDDELAALARGVAAVRRAAEARAGSGQARDQSPEPAGEGSGISSGR